MTFKERRAIDVSGLAYVLSDRLSGTVGGARLLLMVPVRYLSMLFGAQVVLAALTSAVSPDVPLRNTTRVAGGVASGTVGTAAGIGGPPLALVYQSRSGPESATLSRSLFYGDGDLAAGAHALWRSRSLATLISHLVFALYLLPALFLELWAANYLTSLLSGDWLRPTILLFAALSGFTPVLLAF